MHTLLLNADAQPVRLVPLSAIDWQDAIKYIWLDKAKILHEYEDKVVRSPSYTMKMPAVIILNEYWAPKNRIKFNRKWVFLRDNYTCQYCKEVLVSNDCTIDHVVPVSKGGKTVWHNVVTSCRACNHSKGNNEKIVPDQMPEIPDYWALASNRSRKKITFPHESWKYYLGIE
jgi:5-methylcytosine-specific restriction endonuclease McrA